MPARLTLICASVLGLLILALAGCSFGPMTINQNRIRYNEAVRQTWNEEFLLNMVRLRYRDPPQFDAVTNILASHSFDSAMNAREELRYNGQTPAKGTINSSIFSLGVFGGNAGISERPTITYSPLEGPEFTKHLLGQIHLESIILLGSTGWDVDRVLRLTVQKMNQLEYVHQLSGTPERTPRFEEFTLVSRRLGALQEKGWLELAYHDFERPLSEAWPVPKEGVKASDLLSAADKKMAFHHVAGADKEEKFAVSGTERAPVLRIAPEAWTHSEDALEVAKALNLHDNQPHYRLVAGAETGHFKQPDDPSTIVVSTRSVLGALLFASKGVEVPRKHVEQGLVCAPMDEAGQAFDWTVITGDLIRVHSQRLRPLHAFASVHYRGHWFYIDDCDLTSKSTFALIIELYGLELAGGVIPGPIVTVPVGGGVQVAPSGKGTGKTGGAGGLSTGG